MSAGYPERGLAAILFGDIVGYTAHMAPRTLGPLIDLAGVSGPPVDPLLPGTALKKRAEARAFAGAS